MQQYTNVMPDAELPARSLNALVLDHRHKSLQFGALVLMGINFAMRDGPMLNFYDDTKVSLEASNMLSEVLSFELIIYEADSSANSL